MILISVDSIQVTEPSELFSLLPIGYDDNVISLLSSPEAARQLNVSLAMVQYLLKDGQLRASKIAGRYLVEPSEIARFKATPRIRLRKPGPGRPKKIKNSSSVESDT